MKRETKWVIYGLLLPAAFLGLLMAGEAAYFARMRHLPDGIVAQGMGRA